MLKMIPSKICLESMNGLGHAKVSVHRCGMEFHYQNRNKRVIDIKPDTTLMHYHTIIQLEIWVRRGLRGD